METEKKGGGKNQNLMEGLTWVFLKIAWKLDSSNYDLKGMWLIFWVSWPQPGIYISSTIPSDQWLEATHKNSCYSFSLVVSPQ